MRISCILELLFIQHFLTARAADGPIDFEKTPTGGPSTLRACAQYAYNSNSRAGSVYSLGCSTISCVCRSDLVQEAHELITDAVVANCGEDATVDIEQAIKVYDDYCSSNGYSIPGYTYVMTSTVKVPPSTSTSGAQMTSEPLETSETSTTSQISEEESASLSPTATVTTSLPPIATVTASLPPIATVTAIQTIIIESSGRKEQPWSIFQLAVLACIFPIRHMYALADSIIVTYTPPAPSPAFSLVVTTFTTEPGAPVTSVATVYATDSPYVPTSTVVTMAYGETVANTYSATTARESSVSSGVSGSGNRNLSNLEIVGIVCGIVGGMITTIATVWMCARGNRRHLVTKVLTGPPIR